MGGSIDTGLADLRRGRSHTEEPLSVDPALAATPLPPVANQPRYTVMWVAPSDLPAERGPRDVLDRLGARWARPPPTHTARAPFPNQPSAAHDRADRIVSPPLKPTMPPPPPRTPSGTLNKRPHPADDSTRNLSFHRRPPGRWFSADAAATALLERGGGQEPGAANAKPLRA